MTKLFLLLFSLLAANLVAQRPTGPGNLDPAVLLSFGYGPFSTGGDLGDRFGGGFSLTGGVDYLPGGAGWELGVMASYGFGNVVREDVLAGLRTDAGYLIGNQRAPADVALRQRHLFIGPRFGYTFAFGANRRAGLKTTTALGYFYSRIRFQEDPVQYLPQIDPSRQAGYDRLTGGPALYQFLGYQQLALDRRLNFFVGGEVIYAATKHLRAYDVALAGPSAAGGRQDLVFGLRIGLILPIYLGTGEEIFY